jgi:hypothetical protein
MSKLKCDFCQEKFDVEQQTFEDGRQGSLIAGPGVFICDGCIDLAKVITDENRVIRQIHMDQGYCELGPGYFVNR